MARIAFEVTTRAVTHDLWVRARNREPQRLEVTDGKAHADLPEGRYDLFWSISGPPECPIRVVARQAGEPVLEVSGAIPPRRLDAAGAERFTVKGREALRAARESQQADVMPFAAAVARRAAASAPVTPVTARLAAPRLGSGRNFAAAE